MERISVDGGRNKCICPDSTDNSWFGNVTLNDSQAKPGEIWSVSVTNCKTGEVCYHGTMSAGDTQGFSSDASGKPGSGFSFSATGYLFGAGGQVTAQGSAQATFPDCCDPDPGCNPSSSSTRPRSGGGRRGNSGGSGGNYVPPP